MDADQHMGHFLASGGDVDGDGCPDILVGCPYDNDTTNDAVLGSNLSGERGAVYAFSADPAGVVSPAYGAEHQPLYFAAQGDQVTTHFVEWDQNVDVYFGWSLAGLGDWDGNDTFDDWLAGAPRCNNDSPATSPCVDSDPVGGRLSGRVLIIAGGPFPQFSDFPHQYFRYIGELGADGGRDRLGIAVAAGDMLGGIRRDVLLDASGHTEPVQPGESTVPETGRVYVFENTIP